VKHNQRTLHVGVEVRLDVSDLRRSNAELRRQLDPVRLDRLGDVRQTQLRLRNVLLCDATSVQQHLSHGCEWDFEVRDRDFWFTVRNETETLPDRDVFRYVGSFHFLDQSFADTKD